MDVNTGLIGKSFGAVGTFEALDLIMHVHVTFVMTSEVETFVTDFTGEFRVVEMHFVDV